jgi:BatD DUF11 like domain
MFIMFKKIFSVFFVVAMHNAAMAQPAFSAAFTPAEIGKDEYATLRLVIENGNDIGKITLPAFKDFVVAGGPSQESGMSTVNGTVNKYVALSYILQPRHTGSIVLPPATAVIDGKKYSSGVIKLFVKKSAGSSGNNATNPFAMLDPFAAQPPKQGFSDFILRKGENVPDKVNKNMQLVLQTSKKTCYVGEPILASYKLFTRLKNESRLVKNPSFNGFSVIDLQQPGVTDYSREKLNGREYNVYTVRKAQLYPLQSGTIELETAEMENQVQFLKDEAQNTAGNLDGFLNNFVLDPAAVVTQQVTLTSKPVTINVMPLPEKGKPASFNGAVGRFEINAALEKNNFSTDETGKLVLVVSGRGNLQLVTAPDISWPQQMEAFEARVTEELGMWDVPVSGRRIFEIPFTVQAAGKHEVPAIELSYFDPAAAAYRTIRTKAIPFDVVKGSNKRAQLPGSVLHQQPKSFSQKIGENRWWVVSVIALGMLLGLWFWVRHDKNETDREKLMPVLEDAAQEQAQNIPFSQKADEGMKDPLRLSAECLGNEDCRGFYALLNQELKTFLATKFSLPMQEINAKNVSAKMDEAGIDNEVALNTQKLMQDIEWQLYTPYERTDTMHELYARCRQIIGSMHTRNSATL